MTDIFLCCCSGTNLCNCFVGCIQMSLTAEGCGACMDGQVVVLTASTTDDGLCCLDGTFLDPDTTCVDPTVYINHFANQFHVCFNRDGTIHDWSIQNIWSTSFSPGGTTYGWISLTEPRIFDFVCSPLSFLLEANMSDYGLTSSPFCPPTGSNIGFNIFTVDCISTGCDFCPNVMNTYEVSFPPVTVDSTAPFIVGGGSPNVCINGFPALSGWEIEDFTFDNISGPTVTFLQTPIHTCEDRHIAAWLTLEFQCDSICKVIIDMGFEGSYQNSNCAGIFYPVNFLLPMTLNYCDTFPTLRTLTLPPTLTLTPTG